MPDPPPPDRPGSPGHELRRAEVEERPEAAVPSAPRSGGDRRGTALRWLATLLVLAGLVWLGWYLVS